MIPRRTFLQSIASLFALPFVGRGGYRMPYSEVPLLDGIPQVTYTQGGCSRVLQVVAGGPIKAGQAVHWNGVGEVVAMGNNVFGVALESVAAGEKVECATQGVFELPDSVDRGEFWA